MPIPVSDESLLNLQNNLIKTVYIVYTKSPTLAFYIVRLMRGGIYMCECKPKHRCKHYYDGYGDGYSEGFTAGYYEGYSDETPAPRRRVNCRGACNACFRSNFRATRACEQCFNVCG